MQICKSSDCTGCMACMNICPMGAIGETADDFGNLKPQVDMQKCTKCGLCVKTCPSNFDLELKSAECSYAVYSEDPQDKQFSSSGGAAAVFSRYVLDEGGCVFGASCVDGKTVHVCGETLNEIDGFRGSKYVQSDVGMSYIQVKRQLLQGKTVMFTGTPCQVAGLKAYLGRDYENLITVDLICHGTPPHKYLEEHINTKVRGKVWNEYAFRGKYDFFLTVYDKDKIIYKADRWQDEYFYGFLSGLIFRESCYTCKYSRIERVSDITIGDFWGLDRKTLKKHYDGRISLILPNTEKGKDFFEKCKSNFVWEMRTTEEAAHPLQCNLRHPSRPHKERNQFMVNYLKYGFTKSVRKTDIGRKIIKEKIKAKLRPLKRAVCEMAQKIKQKV